MNDIRLDWMISDGYIEFGNHSAGSMTLVKEEGMSRPMTMSHNDLK